MTQPKIDHMEAVRPDSIVQTTVGGVACWAFTVKPGDVQEWDRAEGNRGPNGQFSERAEISYAPAQGTLKYKGPYNVREGMLQTYDVDYWFAPGWPVHDAAKHEWAVLTQFHPQDDTKSSFKGFGGVTCHNSALTFERPSGDGSYFGKVPIVTEKWIKMRMVVNWSSKADGFAKVIDRATGALICLYNGPTIAAGEYKYGPKQGYYRAGGLPNAMVYQTQIDISDGDLSETAPTPTPVPTPVQPDAARVALQAAVAQFDALIQEATEARDKAKVALGMST